MPRSVTSVAGRLGGGDRRSIGDADAVARALLRDESLVAEAVGLMSGGDAVRRARSADALEKAARLRPGILQPYKGAVLWLMSTTRQKEVRWHIAQILPRIALDPRERQQVVRVLEAYLDDESRIVQVCALQALWDLAASEPRQRRAVRRLVTRLAVAGSPAVRARARRLLAGAAVSSRKSARKVKRRGGL